MNNKFLIWLKTWWWLIVILFTVIGWAGNVVWDIATENGKLKTEIVNLKERMQEQLSKQLTEKDVLILIKLFNDNTKQNINDLEKM
ncbi:MAG: hypothetical protein RDU14_17910, partial [Melioribacteraceae bacterium]|nr:hypothetical protein [Melioribacteraceae bacterium]